jgi:hypothetical protein
VVTVDGLLAGTTYYFALKAVDESTRYGELSNVAVTTTLSPRLAWYKLGAYWGSYTDYRDRSLTVQYLLRNKGTAVAVDARIEATFGIPATCYPLTSMPINVGDIESNSELDVAIRYHVPSGIGSFVATTYAGCYDQAGGEHWFPEPLIKPGA